MSFGEKISEKPRLEFYGGTVVGALPMIFFIGWAIICSLLGVGTEPILIVGMIIGLVIGLFTCKSGWSQYADAMVRGMSQEIGIIAILAYYWSGMFSQVIRAGGFVDGLIWLGFKTNVTGGMFTGVVFILATLFGTATGTAYGTITTFSLLMLPAGIALGAHPLFLIGAIISGGIFGDNVAPISDTTIISATTQETDIPGVVRTRFKYAIASALIALVVFVTFGGNGESVQNTEVLLELQKQVEPSGLIIIIPFIVVIYLAFRGNHLITSLTVGTILSCILIPIMGIPLSTIINVDFQNQVVEGAIIDGISGYFPLSIMLLFVMAGSYIMEASGFMDELKEAFMKIIKGSVRRAELVIYVVTAIFAVLITHNAASGIAVSSFVREIGKKYNIHPYRRANLLDALIASLAGVIPWGGHLLLTTATVATVAKTYEFVPLVSPVEVVPYILHGWFLPVVMLFAVLTGWGLEFDNPEDAA